MHSPMYISFNSPRGKGCKQALHYLFFGIIHCKQLVSKIIFSIQKSLSAQARAANGSPIMVRIRVITSVLAIQINLVSGCTMSLFLFRAFEYVQHSPTPAI